MENKIESYFDENLNIYKVVVLTDIPDYKIINNLNYRVFSYLNSDNEVIRDPIINNSKYIFKLNSNYVNKKMYFVFSFDKNFYENIKEITFGLCDEKVAWINTVSYKNIFFLEKKELIKNEDINSNIVILDSNISNVNNVPRQSNNIKQSKQKKSKKF